MKFGIPVFVGAVLSLSSCASKSLVEWFNFTPGKYEQVATNKLANSAIKILRQIEPYKTRTHASLVFIHYGKIPELDVSNKEVLFLQYDKSEKTTVQDHKLMLLHAIGLYLYDGLSEDGKGRVGAWYRETKSRIDSAHTFSCEQFVLAHLPPELQNSVLTRESPEGMECSEVIKYYVGILQQVYLGKVEEALTVIRSSCIVEVARIISTRPDIRTPTQLVNNYANNPLLAKDSARSFFATALATSLGPQVVQQFDEMNKTFLIESMLRKCNYSKTVEELLTYYRLDSLEIEKRDHVRVSKVYIHPKNAFR